jgi:purine-cytosine permease-like protein
MFGTGNTLQFSTCLFYVLLMLSFVLSVSNVADEDKKEKAFPISILVINSLVIFGLLLQMFGVKMMGDLKQYSLLIFFVVLILSFVLSIENVSDEDQENKSLPTIVLVVNSIVILMVGYNFAKHYIK